MILSVYLHDLNSEATVLIEMEHVYAKGLVEHSTDQHNIYLKSGLIICPLSDMSAFQ